MGDDKKIKRLSKALAGFEKKIKNTCLTKTLSKELLFLSKKTQAHLKKGDFNRADDVLATALLTIKRNLGTEISLRQGFELSSILVEDMRAHMAAPAVLAHDAADFAEGFFQIYSDHAYRGAGVPDYLMQRRFPKNYKRAADQIVKVIEGFELPKAQMKLLKNDIKAIEKQAAVFSEGKATDDALMIQNVLITTLYYDMLDMRGVYLSQHHILTVMGMVLFALPAWLCAAPPAWIVQGIIVVLGLVGYGIYSAMRSAASKKAYKNMWAFISGCSNTVAQALAQLNIEIAGLDADQKKDLKDALNKTLTKLNKMTFTGNKGKVAQKLRALIAAL